MLASDGPTILSYGSGGGYAPLRELIGDWFRVHPSRVVLTNGWHQGFALLLAGLPPGRSVAIERPSDDRTVATLLASGASALYLASDGHGLITSDLESQLIQYAQPALIYTNPTFANPTGSVMPLARRRHLIELLDAHNRLRIEQLVLVEDDSFALTRFEGEREPALFDLARGRSVYGSSFSAAIAPGLRVGWLILPDELAAGVAARATATYISPALLGQATVFEFIRRGHLEPHLEALRERLRARRDALLAALAEHFPGAVWSRPEGGYFVWLELPSGTDGRAVVERADGVSAAPGSAFGATANLLRLSFAAAAPEEIESGVARLAAAMPEA